MKHWLAVLLFFFVSACSTSGGVMNVERSNEVSLSGRTVAVTVDAQDVTEDERAGRLVQDVQVELISRLMAAGPFQSVVRHGEDHDLVLKVRLTDVREVSGAARVWWGAMAGANTLTGVVQLVDPLTGDALTTFDVEAKSAAHPFSGASDMKDAVQEFARVVIDAL